MNQSQIQTNEPVFRAPLCINPPKADVLVLRDIEPFVASYEDNTFVGLSVEHYEYLALNLQDILVFVTQQQAIIDYYATCLERAK